MNARRLDLLRSLLSGSRLDALLLTSLPSIRYVSGFTGSNALAVVGRQRAVLITDSRYRQQARDDVRHFDVVVARTTLSAGLKRSGILSRLTRVGFEEQQTSVASLRTWRSEFPRNRFVPCSGMVERLSMIKSEAEIDSLRRAASISDRVFLRVLEKIKPGMSELELAAEIAYRHRKYGAEGDAFEPIVAADVRGAYPHARATSNVLKKGTLVTLDFGCRVDGYHSDITRTVALGRVPRALQKMHRIVLAAQKEAIGRIRAGLPVRTLDAAARGVIRMHGYGRYFNHSLGHGLGLQIHEPPRVSALSQDILQPGMVITVEPGIYVPGVGGVRIEDDVVVREHGCDVLTHSPSELLVV